uniref:Uncharacterized protein n=1 Tax=Lates calcarifer TaxID=8187 RepID=A0A4W6D613_LATCA
QGRRLRLVLITGAGGGLGRLFAQEFTKHGAEVVLWDVNEVGTFLLVESVLWVIWKNSCFSNFYKGQCR